MKTRETHAHHAIAGPFQTTNRPFAVETIALAILAFLLHPKRGGDFFRMKVPTLMMGAETNTHFDEI